MTKEEFKALASSGQRFRHSHWVGSEWVRKSGQYFQDANGETFPSGYDDFLFDRMLGLFPGGKWEAISEEGPAVLALTELKAWFEKWDAEIGLIYSMGDAHLELNMLRAQGKIMEDFSYTITAKEIEESIQYINKNNQLLT